MTNRHRLRLPALEQDGDDAPLILPVDPTSPRPWISVMIPTYNCASLLAVCLESVLAQDPGEGTMEIVVIDDHSEGDDPRAVVEEIGGGRVSFVAHDSNLGAVATFNDCIRRSHGELVHILHGDDFVIDGFYEEINRLADAWPSAGLYATNFTTVDRKGMPLTQGRTVSSTTVLDVFGSGNPFQFCSTVVRRTAYERCGGFAHRLIHVADFEMWVRISARSGFAVSPEVLAAYRTFDEQHSAGLRRTAGNLIDHEQALVLLARHGDLPVTDRHLAHLRNVARHQVNTFRQLGDAAAEQANLRYWIARATPVERLRRHLGRLRRSAMANRLRHQR